MFPVAVCVVACRLRQQTILRNSLPVYLVGAAEASPCDTEGRSGSKLVILTSRVLVGLLFRAVVAGTGVFAELAFRAVGHVEVEFRSDSLGIRRGFDLENDEGNSLRHCDRFANGRS